MGLFSSKKSIVGSDLLKGAVDNHSHILYGLDDGVQTQETSLKILDWLGQQGLSELWLTPHVMEDVPNTTEALKARFEELSALYQGPVKLHLAAEYMMDNLYEKRLSEGDLLNHCEDSVLIETSILAPPLDLWGCLERTMSKGYRPLIAHPERYRYMSKEDYSRLHDMGCLMQLNLPSVVGYYGDDARARAEYLLQKQWYCMCGSDCHRFTKIKAQYEARELKRPVLKALQSLMQL